MSDRLHVSLGELLRLTPDAARGLGLSFAASDRAARMVVWGEILHGMGLRFAKVHDERIRQAAPRNFAWRFESTDVGEAVVIDAQGKSLLEVGPAALDLANGDAGSAEIGMAIVHDTFGLFLIPELIVRAAERGVPTVILFRTDKAGDPFEGTGMMGIAPSIADSTTIGDFLKSEAPKRLRTAVNAARKLLDEPSQDGTGAGSSFAVISFSDAAGKKDSAIDLKFARAQGNQPWCGFDAFEDRWQEALLQGFSMNRDDWNMIGTLTERVRVPTSERSRQQAG